MSVALLVITDGRDAYLRQALAGLEHLYGPVSERWMYDDTGSRPYRRELAAGFSEFQHINAGPRQGFAGAIRAAWAHLSVHSTADWVFHLEQDFVLNRPVFLTEMMHVMHARPYLVQMALRRQAVNDAERAAGGVIEQHPDEYEDRHDRLTGYRWLEHRRFFTTNPSLYRTSLLREREWPAGRESEGRFGIGLLTDGSPEAPREQVRFGFWGTRADAPWVTHVGEHRAGIGY